MIHETLQWAANAMEGELLGTDGEFRDISTDTRELKEGQIFFCLVANRDGHEFAQQAIDQGCAAVVIDQKHRDLFGRGGSRTAPTTIVVEDTLQALGDLANAWRKKFTIPIIAIGGSNGKTTTKELLKCVLNTHYRVLATEGNLNNLIGVPKTLFQLSPDHQVAIIETGMNEFGELARLTAITEPTMGLITNIGLEHLEKLGDIEGVARAEGELFAGLTPEATAIVNLDDPRVIKLSTRAKKIGFGTSHGEIQGQVLSSQLKNNSPLSLQIQIGSQKEEISLKLPGPHNLHNVLAALAVGHTLGIPLNTAKEALEKFNPAPSRMEIIQLKSGRKIIDDCYNANPSSTMAALETLSQLKGEDQAMAILGEMLELGNYVVEGHRQVGEKTAEQKIDQLIAIGEHAEEIQKGAEAAGMPRASILVFKTPEEAISKLGPLPEKMRWFLVKGSRGIHLEKIVNYLKDRF